MKLFILGLIVGIVVSSTFWILLLSGVPKTGCFLGSNQNYQVVQPSAIINEPNGVTSSTLPIGLLPVTGAAQP